MAKSAGAGSLGGAVSSAVFSGLQNIGAVSGGPGAALAKLFSGALSGAIGGAMVGGPIGAAVGAAAGLATAAIHEFVSALSSVSDKFGESKKAAATLGLSLEAYQSLDYAAKRSAVSSEQFVKSFAHLERSIDEAKGSAGTQRAVFESLGITLQDLTRLSPEEIFNKLADGIKSVDDPSRQATSAMLLLGKGGFEMLPMLKKGADSINALRDKAEQLGISMSGEQQAKMEAYRKALKDLEDNWESMKITLVTNLVPAVTKVVDSINWLMDNFSKLGKYFRDWVAELIAFSSDKLGFSKGLQQAVIDQRNGELRNEQLQRQLDAMNRAQARAQNAANARPVNEESTTGNVEAINKARSIIGKDATDLIEEEVKALIKAKQLKAIGEEELYSGIYNAGSKLIAAMGRVSNTTPMLIKDSKESVEAIIRSRQPNDDPQTAIRNALEQAKVIQEQHRDIGRQMLEELRHLARPKEGGMVNNMLGG